MPRCLYFLVVVASTISIAIAQATTPQSEEDAFQSAIHRKSPEAKAAALESFLNKVPESRLKERSLEILLETYRELQSFPNFENTLDELLKLNPDNLLGLMVKTAASRCGDGASQDFCEKKELDTANRGLRALTTASKPPDMSEEDFRLRKARGSFAFHRTLGLWALRDHDHQAAQFNLRTAADLDPTNFQCVYPLALAYLNADPPNSVQGLFFIARAATLSPASYRKKIEDYGREQYEKYHGSAEGWTQLLKSAKSTPLPPAEFTITPASKNP